MATLQVTKNAAFDGRNFSRIVSTVDDGKESVDPTVAVAKAATLTTRHDVDTGVITVAADHGVVAGDWVHFYWLDAVTGDVMCHRARATSVTATTILFGEEPGSGSDDEGGGDGLPAVNTVGSYMKPNAEDFTVTGNNVRGIVANCPRPGFVIFCLADLTEVLVIDLREYNSYIWSEDDGSTNPLAGAAIAKCLFSHNSITQTAASYAGVLRS